MQVQDVTHNGLWNSPDWGFTVLTTRASRSEQKKLSPGKYSFLTAAKEKASPLIVHSGRPAQSRSFGTERSTEMSRRPAAKTRVFLAAGNRLLRETLARMLRKSTNLEVAGAASLVSDEARAIALSDADILVVTSLSSLECDLEFIRSVKSAAPEMKILLLGMEEDESTFLRCVRAGVSGYLSRDASAEEVIAGVLAVRDGGAVCSGQLCRALFHYLAREAANYPSASLRRCLGLTRREQQLIPLVAQGLTNKEIANHFCLSEQTVKNHLYRMMQKVGVSDRLSIVELCRTQGFVV